MKDNELRKGNLVKLNNPIHRKEQVGNICIVNEIKNDSVNLTDIKALPFTHHDFGQLYKYIDPIELTLDILINNCGFKKEGFNSYVKFAPKGDFKPIIEVCIYTEDEKLETGDDLPMTSLHQLQNYYHAKTGEELEIKF